MFIDSVRLKLRLARARIAQSSALLPVADKPASPVRDVSQGEACPTDSGLKRQHSELLAKFQAQEVEILKLKEMVKVLEDREGIAATRFGDDATIKGRSMDEGEAATERISDDTEEMKTVLNSIDTATVLAGGIDDVPTGSDAVPTASPVFATATVVTPYSRRKGKEVMSNKREEKRMFEQIARDAEVARIHAEEELQSMIDGLERNNETIAKYVQKYQQFAAELPLGRRIELISDLVKYQENFAKIYKFQSQQRKSWTKKQKRDYYMAVIKNNLGWKVKDFKSMTFEEVEAKFNSVYKQMEDFIPMGSKEEAERYKRKGIRFDQESLKKLKSSEEVIEEAKRIVGNKMHKAFPLLTIKFPLPEQLPTASEVGSHWLKKSEATARKISLLC
nr:hypothetical protein [Tanacetum cinerariifolium]